jgi:hypothetical protein
LISIKKALAAKQMAISINRQPAITRGIGERLMMSVGEKSSSKRPHPKHTKKNTGGGMRMSAES